MAIARFEPVVVEKFLDRGAQAREIERGFDRAAVAAIADERAIGPLAQDEAERADEDRFAGAGLARDGVVAGLQLEGQIGDQGEVFDAQRRQHAKFGSC